MTDRGHIEAIKASATGLGLPMLLSRFGYQGKVVRQARGVLVCCLSPFHHDKTPSLSIFQVDDGIAFGCHGCGRKGGDVLALIALALGLDVVREFPRVLAEAEAISGVGPAGTRAMLRRSPVAAKRPSYPPEAAELWARCTSVYADQEVAEYLRSRAIDPALVADRDLARVLPTPPLPAWARFRGSMATAQSWVQLGHRLIIPCYDATGRLATVRARRVRAGNTPKDLPATGYAAGSVVFANSLAQLVLRNGTTPAWWPPPRIVVVEEGGPDFLTVATHFSDDETAPAVLGVFSGSWTPAIAARIPDGCRVIVRTHHDEAGERYARAIASTLLRRCDVLRGVAR